MGEQLDTLLLTQIRSFFSPWTKHVGHRALCNRQSDLTLFYSGLLFKLSTSGRWGANKQRNLKVFRVFTTMAHYFAVWCRKRQRYRNSDMKCHIWDLFNLQTIKALLACVCWVLRQFDRKMCVLWDIGAQWFCCCKASGRLTPCTGTVAWRKTRNRRSSSEWVISRWFRYD